MIFSTTETHTEQYCSCSLNKSSSEWASSFYSPLKGQCLPAPMLMAVEEAWEPVGYQQLRPWDKGPDSLDHPQTSPCNLEETFWPKKKIKTETGFLIVCVAQCCGHSVTDKRWVITVTPLLLLNYEWSTFWYRVFHSGEDVGILAINCHRTGHENTRRP